LGLLGAAAGLIGAPAGLFGAPPNLGGVPAGLIGVPAGLMAGLPLTWLERRFLSALLTDGGGFDGDLPIGLEDLDGKEGAGIFPWAGRGFSKALGREAESFRRSTLLDSSAWSLFLGSGKDFVGTGLEAGGVGEDFAGKLGLLETCAVFSGSFDWLLLAELECDLSLLMTTFWLSLGLSVLIILWFSLSLSVLIILWLSLGLSLFIITFWPSLGLCPCLSIGREDFVGLWSLLGASLESSRFIFGILGIRLSVPKAPAEGPGRGTGGSPVCFIFSLAAFLSRKSFSFKYSALSLLVISLSGSSTAGVLAGIGL
jgi:hypothetical protein